MKRMFTVIAAAVLAIPILAAGCAKESPAPRARPKTTDAAVGVKKAAPKPRIKVFTGTVVAVDEPAGTLTLKGSKTEMHFRLRDRKEQLDGLAIGDKLIVKHVDAIAFSVVKIRTSNSAMALEEKKVSCREFDPSSVAQ